MAKRKQNGNRDRTEKALCGCGCGGEVKTGNKYINGHNQRSKTKETDDCIKRASKNLSKTKKEFLQTDEGQMWLDNNLRGENHPHYGKKSWHSGKTKETDDRLKKLGKSVSKTKKEFFKTEEGQKYIEKHLKSENHPMYEKGYLVAGEKNGFCGKHHTEETKQLLREINIGENAPNYGKRDEETSMFGKHHTKETKQSISKSLSGENSPNWKGGISYLPYCEKFNENLKERVRNFFNRCCYFCGKSEQEQIDEMIKRGKKQLKRLDVHHVNYDKMICCNNVKPLFVPLCRTCHNKTNRDREYWEEFFTVSLEYLTDGECFLAK